MRIKLFIGIALFFIIFSEKVIDYTDYFNEKSCRVDFHFAGNVNTTSAYTDKIKEEPYWGGGKLNLTTFLNLGDYRFQLLDSISGNLININGFSIV